MLYIDSDLATENLEVREEARTGVDGWRGTTTLRSAGGPWSAMRRARSGGFSDICLSTSGVGAGMSSWGR